MSRQQFEHLSQHSVRMSHGLISPVCSVVYGQFNCTKQVEIRPSYSAVYGTAVGWGRGIDCAPDGACPRCARVARPPGRAAHRARRASAARFEPGFLSANSAIHIKKPAQGGLFNMAGGEGLTARLKALALATLGSLARQGGLRIELAAQARLGSNPGSYPQTPLSILKNPHKAGFLIWLGERDSNPR